MQKIMTGKVKEVYEVDADTLEFAYTDNISVFDKIIPSKIPHKGETLCRTTGSRRGRSPRSSSDSLQDTR